MHQNLINKDPEILGGTPVFSGTRVPIRILFEHLEAGDSVESRTAVTLTFVAVFS
jgi:uncharacterized protein (DUF433 family)